MGDYAWVITRDLFAEEDGGNVESEVGVSGPRDVDPSIVADVIRKGITFKMYDGDGEHMYTGRIWHLDGPDACHFQPLDDFGIGNAGCTEIRYYNPTTKKWEAL